MTPPVAIRDYYGPSAQSLDTRHARTQEPGDPNDINHTSRRATRLAPGTVEIDTLPKELTEEILGDRYPLTVEAAQEKYIKIHLGTLDDEINTSANERHRYTQYPQLLRADRHFRETYRDLTTVMLTRRLNPISEDTPTGWLTPWELVEELHEATRSIRRALNRHLDWTEFEYVGVTAPTRSAATPHEHIYLWIDDPGNEVTTSDIEPALDMHLKHCPNALEKHHQFRQDGSEGAITVEYDPPITDRTDYENTTGAQYLASQLVHLPLGDLRNPAEKNPKSTLLEGGAIAWATKRDWVRSSNGVKRLNNSDTL